MQKILPAAFFDRPVIRAAKNLLDKYFIRRWRGKEISLLITEVEAYDGPRDLASHASHGRTRRTEIIFGPAGVFYVYFTYGMHWLMNVVTGPKDYPAAILIRAGEYYNAKTKKWVLINGPARLTKFLHVTGAQNGKIARRKTGLWFEDRGVEIRQRDVTAGKRVGVDYAGPIWSEKRWSFKLGSKTLRER